MLTFSLFSQGILLSATKSIRNLEDDMVFNTFRLGKAIQKEDTAQKTVIAPSLEQYKNDESSSMNDDENKNSKVSGNVEIWMIFMNPLKVKSMLLFYKQKYEQIVTICIRPTVETSYISGCSFILDNTSYPKGSFSPKTCTYGTFKELKHCRASLN